MDETIRGKKWEDLCVSYNDENDYTNGGGHYVREEQSQERNDNSLYGGGEFLDGHKKVERGTRVPYDPKYKDNLVNN